MQDLKTMTTEELRQLATSIKVELDNRIKELKEVKKEVEEVCLNEYKFYFKTECAFRNRGYVARCYYDGKLQRKFKKLEETEYGKNLLIEGCYNAKENDVLDIRYRNSEYGESGYYIVLEGKLTKICDISDIHKVSSIKRYLKGEIIFENFLEIVGLKEIEVGVIDELFED